MVYTRGYKRPRNHLAHGSFRVHGNYCGPGWSDGKWQISVPNPKKAPMDEIDAICREHDMNYARGMSKKKADQIFVNKMRLQPGVKAALMATGVGVQGSLRKRDPEKGLVSSSKKRRLRPPTPPPDNQPGDPVIESISPAFNTTNSRTSVDMVQPKRVSIKKLRRYKKITGRRGGKRGAYRRVGVAKSQPSLAKAIVSRGVQFTNEFGLTVKDDCSGGQRGVLFFGHHDAPASRLLSGAWIALVKHMLLKAGLTFNLLDDNLSALNAGDVIGVLWRQTSGATSSFYTVTMGTISAASSGVLSVVTIAGYLTGNGPWYSPITEVDFTSILENIQIIPVTRTVGTGYQELVATKVNLLKSRVSFICSSALKMQNRTTNISPGGVLPDDDYTAVDNVPLYVKGYFKKGNQFQAPGRIGGSLTSMALIGQTDQGYLCNGNNADSGFNFGEPPNAKVIGAKPIKCSKFLPGAIMTSKLSSTFSIPFIDLFKYIGPVNNAAVKTLKGSSKLYCFDKVIEELRSADTPARRPIIIATETQLTVGCLFKEGRSSMTTNLYSFDADINGI